MKAAAVAAASAKPANPTDARARLVKVIHVARRELQLEDDTYRAMLQTAGGADSTSAMGLPALQRVLDHLKAKGFKVRASTKPGIAPRKPDRRQDTSASARKVRALWLFLHVLGAVRDPSEAALAAYVKRIAKVDDLHWAHGGRVDGLIETLKQWGMRLLPAAVAALGTELAAKGQDPVRSQALEFAAACLQRGRGFDMHWWAWDALSHALGHVQRPELKVLAPVAAAAAAEGSQP